MTLEEFARGATEKAVELQAENAALKEEITAVRQALDGYDNHAEPVAELVKAIRHRHDDYVESICELKEENERLRGMTAVLQFLEKADDLISVYPFLYVEIARTRVTDWMAWLRTKPKEGEGKTLAIGQGLTSDEACEAALAELNKQPGSEV